VVLDVDTAQHLAEEAMRIGTTCDVAALHLVRGALMGDRRGPDLDAMPVGSTLHRAAVDHWIASCVRGGSGSGSTAERALDRAPWTKEG
jgi:hypothetical protein